LKAGRHASDDSCAFTTGTSECTSASSKYKMDDASSSICTATAALPQRDMPPTASPTQIRPRSSSTWPVPLPLPLPMPQSPFRIKHDGKFHDRLLAKDRAARIPSRCSYYCTDRGLVPFRWESRPGTPIDHGVAAAAALPSVTLPPSYLIRHCYDRKVSPPQKRRAKRKIFGRLTLRLQCLRLRAALVKVSSSSRRWLFAERDDEHYHDDHEPAVEDQCSPPRPSPWMLPFRFSGFENRSVRRWPRLAGR
jgi:hypothetical protein